MQRIHPHYNTYTRLLFIEPTKGKSAVPVLDEYTMRMKAAWDVRLVSEHSWRGFHVCVCGAWRDNKDHYVGRGFGIVTNSLCLHYLAWHREEIPPDQLKIVASLTLDVVMPTPAELY